MNEPGKLDRLRKNLMIDVFNSGKSFRKMKVARSHRRSMRSTRRIVGKSWHNFRMFVWAWWARSRYHWTPSIWSRFLQMRHLYLVLDLSDAMKDQDLRPNRLFCAIEVGRSSCRCAQGAISFLATQRIHFSLLRFQSHLSNRHYHHPSETCGENQWTSRQSSLARCASRTIEISRMWRWSLGSECSRHGLANLEVTDEENVRSFSSATLHFFD